MKILRMFLATLGLLLFATVAFGQHVSFKAQGSSKMVGRWGRNTEGGASLLEVTYSEFVFKGNGTYTETGRVFTQKYEIQGIYRLTDNQLEMRDVKIVSQQRPDTVTLSTYHYVLFPDGDQFGIDHQISFQKGMHWDFTQKHYFDEAGHRLYTPWEKQETMQARTRQLEDQWARQGQMNGRLTKAIAAKYGGSDPPFEITYDEKFGYEIRIYKDPFLKLKEMGTRWLKASPLYIRGAKISYFNRSSTGGRGP